MLQSQWASASIKSQWFVQLTGKNGYDKQNVLLSL